MLRSVYLLIDLLFSTNKWMILLTQHSDKENLWEKSFKANILHIILYIVRWKCRKTVTSHDICIFPYIWSKNIYRFFLPSFEISRCIYSGVDGVLVLNFQRNNPIMKNPSQFLIINDKYVYEYIIFNKGIVIYKFKYIFFNNNMNSFHISCLIVSSFLDHNFFKLHYTLEWFSTFDSDTFKF